MSHEGYLLADQPSELDSPPAAARPAGYFRRCWARSASTSPSWTRTSSRSSRATRTCGYLQFSVALESQLLETVSEDELAAVRSEAERELAETSRWGTTFTLIQAWGRVH